MTAELEQDMDQIAAGEDLQGRGRCGSAARCCTRTTTDLSDKREDLAKEIWAGMDEDKFLGPCKVCEEAGRKHEDGSPNRLRIIELKGGKRMYGCEGWNRDDPESPDSCTVSGPLPGRGYELWRLEERCSICGETPRLTVEGLPRPALEALPQRRLPVDGRDAREARRAPGGARRRGRPPRRTAPTADEATGSADGQEAAQAAADGRAPRKQALAEHGAHQARPLVAAER